MPTTKKVVDTVAETKEKEVDIEALIKAAVEKTAEKTAIETAKKYQSKIDELQNKLNDFSKIPDNKKVKIMHMAPGCATFDNGHVHVRFEDKLFDTVSLKFDTLSEMVDNWKPWFLDCEIVVLDTEARKELELEYEFEDHGADKKKFEEILKMDTKEMLDSISKLTTLVRYNFLKYFMECHIKGDPECLKGNKYFEVINYFENHEGLKDLQLSLSDFLSTK